MSDVITSDTIDPLALRESCGRFATGVTVITTQTSEGVHGMTVSAFMSVSLDPPLICISLDRQSKMLSKIEVSGCFAVNVLAEDMHRHAMHFAGRADETLTALFEHHQSGLPVLRSAAAVIVTDLVQQVEAGDHVLLLGHVRYLDRNLNTAPLVYHAGRFGSLVSHEFR